MRRVARRSIGLLFAMILVTTPAVVLAGHHFPDVPSTNPFHSEIGAVAEAGITAGFNDGGYNPGDPVTRQAMAAFMHRGFGRAGLTIGHPSGTPSVFVAPGASNTTHVPVQELAITVPGASNDFSPTQLVHLQGRVHFLTPMNAAQGCPCEFAARIRDTTTNAFSIEQSQTFESSSSNSFLRAFDVEALFAAAPGPRTYRVEVRLALRDDITSAADFEFSDHTSSLSAMTFPFGPAGSDSLSSAGAQNAASDVDQLPERRRDE